MILRHSRFFNTALLLPFVYFALLLGRAPPWFPGVGGYSSQYSLGYRVPFPTATQIHQVRCWHADAATHHCTIQSNLAGIVAAGNFREPQIRILQKRGRFVRLPSTFVLLCISNIAGRRAFDYSIVRIMCQVQAATCVNCTQTEAQC